MTREVDLKEAPRTLRRVGMFTAVLAILFLLPASRVFDDSARDPGTWFVVAVFAVLVVIAAFGLFGSKRLLITPEAVRSFYELGPLRIGRTALRSRISRLERRNIRGMEWIQIVDAQGKSLLDLSPSLLPSGWLTDIERELGPIGPPAPRPG